MAKKLLWLGVGFLVIGLALVTGLIPVGRAVGAYVTLPVGVVLLGMSLIWHMLALEEEKAATVEVSPSGQAPATAEKAPGGSGGCGCGGQH